LRALKKLEQETAPRESETQPSEQKLKKSPLNYRDSGRFPVVNKFLIVLAVILLLGVLAWVIIQKTGTRKESPGMDKQQESPAAGAPSLNTPIQAPILEKVSPREMLPGRVSGEQTKPPIGVPGSNSSQLQQPQKVEEPVQPVTAKPVDRETKAKHPVFTLTGILWSESPARRLALINDRYLKEGEKINGATLIRIEETEVTFKSGVETWSIELAK
jgi:cytoskeletal protein RodZ